MDKRAQLFENEIPQEPRCYAERRRDVYRNKNQLTAGSLVTSLLDNDRDEQDDEPHCRWLLLAGMAAHLAAVGLLAVAWRKMNMFDGDETQAAHTMLLHFVIASVILYQHSTAETSSSSIFMTLMRVTAFTVALSVLLCVTERQACEDGAPLMTWNVGFFACCMSVMALLQRRHSARNDEALTSSIGAGIIAFGVVALLAIAFQTALGVSELALVGSFWLQFVLVVLLCWELPQLFAVLEDEEHAVNAAMYIYQDLLLFYIWLGGKTPSFARMALRELKRHERKLEF